MRDELQESRGMRTNLEGNEEAVILRKGRCGLQRKPEKDWETLLITKTKKLGIFKMVERNKAML